MTIRKFNLQRPFAHFGGHAWQAYVDIEGDGPVGSPLSDLLILENDEPLGPHQSIHADIREHGRGRFSHWQNYVCFSTRDNSDPNSNGRAYMVEVTPCESAQGRANFGRTAPRPSPRFYRIADLRVSPSPWTADISPLRAMELLSGELEAARQRPDYTEIEALKSIAMLHVDSLVLLRYLAAVTQGAVLELGSYIGGSAVMLARGATPPRKVITFEMGISHPTHHCMPSLDTWDDLQNTIESQGLSQRVERFKMKSTETQARFALSEVLQGEKISLLCIDADGWPRRDIEAYRPFLAPGCVVVIDDLGAGEHGKGERVIPQINELMSDETLIKFGMFKWETWFGRLSV